MIKLIASNNTAFLELECWTFFDLGFAVPELLDLIFLIGTISNVLVMEIGWTDVGSGGYILVSCAHSNTNLS
jgi:hypothetical protein